MTKDNLKSHKAAPTKMLLLLESGGEHCRGLCRGIAKYSRLHGPWMFYRERQPYWPKENFFSTKNKKIAMDYIEHIKPDGIIMGFSKFIEDIVATGVPIISHLSYTEDCSNVPNIVSDNLAIAKLAVEHFLSRGFKNFAYFGNEPYYYSVDRGEKFAQLISDAGFQTHVYINPKPSVRRKSDWFTKQRLLAEWVGQLPKPIAIMANNDEGASEILFACNMASVQVPEQVAILGVDNDEFICDLSQLPLSSICINSERVGYETAQLLDDIMAGKKKMANQQIVVKPSHIIVRHSTDTIAIEDADIATAVHFIRNNPKKLIGVDDVAAAAAMSRRNLQRRFQAALGRSVIDEIKHVRIETAKSHITETDLSIAKIAEILNFSSTKHLSRFFKHETGMTLKECRTKYS